MTDPRPHYVTTPHGQIRLWLAGEGADLVALPGLIRSAEDLARELAAAHTGMRVIVPDLPGIGGSSEVNPEEGPDRIVDALFQALDWLGDRPPVVVGLDLSGPLAALLAQRLSPSPALLVGAALGEGWRKAGITPPDLRPRQDGTHLQALWSFLRDRHLLIADDPSQPATGGEPLPGPEALSTCFVAAATRPERYAALWNLCLRLGPSEGTPITGLSALGAHLSGGPASGLNPPPTRPGPTGTIWHDYVETRNGRIHLRRSGSGGKPVLVIPTGGGSSAQFAPVVTGLGQDRAAFAVDYPGNGLSGKWSSMPTIESLAADMLALIDAMNLDEIDIWGSHTGSLVALELALLAPERIGKVVMEGPVFISADFQADLLDNYFPPIRPDKWGLHLPLVWNWRRDMFMYWPWYRVDRAAARQLGVPSAEQLHLYAIGILESGETYHGAYRSAFAYDTRARMPLMRVPSLICAGPNDMLKNGVEESRAHAPADLTTFAETPTTIWWPDPDPVLAAETLAVYRAFFDA